MRGLVYLYDILSPLFKFNFSSHVKGWAVGRGWEGVTRAEALFHTLALKLIAGGFPPEIITSLFSLLDHSSSSKSPVSSALQEVDTWNQTTYLSTPKPQLDSGQGEGTQSPSFQFTNSPSSSRPERLSWATRFLSRIFQTVHFLGGLTVSIILKNFLIWNDVK